MAFPVELSDAARLIEETDDDERDARAGRLVELSDLLGSRPLALHGLAAEWLFEDVKATWLYGYFTGTVLAAYAFCIQQLAGFVRTMPDDPAISDDAVTLEVLAEIAHQHDLIDGDVRARLVRLHDSAFLYLAAGLVSYRRHLERRAEDAETFMDEHALLIDARTALECCVGLLEPKA
jgi:hypothetical protein